MRSIKMEASENLTRLHMHITRTHSHIFYHFVINWFLGHDASLIFLNWFSFTNWFSTIHLLNRFVAITLFLDTRYTDFPLLSDKSVDLLVRNCKLRTFSVLFGTYSWNFGLMISRKCNDEFVFKSNFRSRFMNFNCGHRFHLNLIYYCWKLIISFLIKHFSIENQLIR